MNIYFVKFFAFCLIPIFLFSSCASIFNSGSQTILARSSDNKEGVEVEVTSPSGSYPTKLPATIAAEPANDGVTIRVIDKCYDSTQIKVNQSVTPSFWANILWLTAFPIAMGIDALSGKMWKYNSNVSVPVNKKQECDSQS